ncbi:hypothetical protein [Streptomyces sp. WAC01280]|uniref:hypothetical protein n=1 Tax=Streptomyces sp. WAC01280 TaxID=2487424 RepID=UPI000F7748A8|nr:hypothetical protein [Streptomyces sp. WAC01280]RSS50061.1 hypothetical protein EF909_39310 [Streptomyces sp. WAC01280]
MPELTYPETFKAATAYLTTYIALDDEPTDEDEELANSLFEVLTDRPRVDVAMVFSAMLGALVAELAEAQGEEPRETWARHATAYSLVIDGVEHG